MPSAIAPSARDVIGYEDLGDYGSWRAAEGYGNVWVPTHSVHSSRQWRREPRPGS